MNPYIFHKSTRAALRFSVRSWLLQFLLQFWGSSARGWLEPSQWWGCCPLSWFRCHGTSCPPMCHDSVCIFLQSKLIISKVKQASKTNCVLSNGNNSNPISSHEAEPYHHASLYQVCYRRLNNLENTRKAGQTHDVISRLSRETACRIVHHTYTHTRTRTHTHPHTHAQTHTHSNMTLTHRRDDSSVPPNFISRLSRETAYRKVPPTYTHTHNHTHTHTHSHTHTHTHSHTHTHAHTHTLSYSHPYSVILTPILTLILKLTLIPILTLLHCHIWLHGH